MKLLPGEVLQLRINRIDEEGCFLDVNGEELPLRTEDIKHDMQEGQELEVFIFIDERIEFAATTELPEIKLNEVGCFRVLNTSTIGAYINIGTSRDIVIPTEEQKRDLERGDKVVIVLKYDLDKRRLIGSTKFGKHFKNRNLNLKIGDKLEGIIIEKMPFGRKVILENRYVGLIFRNDILRPLRLGDRLKFYVKDLKEDEITLSMQKLGEESIKEAKDRILNLLGQHNGYLRLNADTDPEEIKLRLRMSKNTFKKAASELSDENVIVLTKRGIKTKK